jgi:hypothetical protein
MTLYCNEEKVGTFEFDLASYIGKKVIDEKVKIGFRVKGASLDGPSVLEGDLARWKHAFLIFRIKVDPATP